jgi:hypothetical protein
MTLRVSNWELGIGDMLSCPDCLVYLVIARSVSDKAISFQRDCRGLRPRNLWDCRVGLAAFSQ